MKKRELIVTILLLVVAVILSNIVCHRAFVQKTAQVDEENQKTITEIEEADEPSELDEALNKIDRDYAIMTLSELRGRVNQIRYISIAYAARTAEMQDAIRSQLETISVYSGDMDNPYLRGFEITVTTSGVLNICDEIVSQIDAHIYKIRHEEEFFGDTI